jgi:uncharacterized protein (TIGR00255 family)
MADLFSMTGFATSDVAYNNSEIHCEIRSLNSRYLEMNVKMPIVLRNLEDPVKDLIKKSVQRGKVNCIINMKSAVSNLQNLKIDPETVKFYMNLLQQIRSLSNVNEEIRLQHLLEFKDIISMEEDEVLEKEFETLICDLVNDALVKLNEMRGIEGRNLSEDVSQRLSSIDDNLGEIETLSKKNARIEFDKLYKKVISFVGDKKIDENRLEMELAIISDRVDVSEEVVRLKSHIDLFKDNLEQGSPIGKKLNFILQEMHRESNTISSKNTLIEVSRLIVAIKEDIERIREQVQNIE